MKKAKKLVKKHFGDWERAEVPTHTYSLPEHPEKVQVIVVDKPGAVQTLIDVVNTQNLKPNAPDRIQADLANMLLGGGSGFRLYSNLREDKGYTYGAYSQLSKDEVVGSFRASAKVRNEVTQGFGYPDALRNHAHA